MSQSIPTEKGHDLSSCREHCPEAINLNSSRSSLADMREHHQPFLVMAREVRALAGFAETGTPRHRVDHRS